MLLDPCKTRSPGRFVYLGTGSATKDFPATEFVNISSYGFSPLKDPALSSSGSPLGKEGMNGGPSGCLSAVFLSAFSLVDWPSAAFAFSLVDLSPSSS